MLPQSTTALRNRSKMANLKLSIVHLHFFFFSQTSTLMRKVTQLKVKTATNHEKNFQEWSFCACFDM